MNEIFRLDQPLPAPGTTIVLEASAGTGKTYAIAALVTRYVADGLPLDQILAVTFSRRATSELRDGIRTRLIAGKLAIDGWLRDGRLDSSDRVAVLLCDTDPAIARLRADRLDEAIGLVDAAPIFTLHTFAARMLDELLQMLQTVLSEAGVQVSVALPRPQPRLIADPVQLQQVILNLILNAVDAMRDLPGGGRWLRIEVAPEPAGGLGFAVRDSGPGVAADMEARLFEAFYSTKPDGLGMGLAISRSIIENHGGRLWLDRSAGPGACFRFTLPDQ